MSTAIDVDTHVAGPRKYRNSEAMLRAADPVWQAAAEHGLAGIHVDSESNNRLIVPATGHEFINMCSCSYLGLNYHPEIIQGAIDALHDAKCTTLSLATTRIRPTLLARLEDELGDLFDAPVLPGVSCSALTSGILPLLASGHLTDGKPRVMVFDRFSHFNMAYIKPICADESLVLKCDHNDLEFLEDVCRKYPRVAYIADGAYSMGGAAALEGLLELQDRYGLFLYFDDSHSLSIMGRRGVGYTRSRMELNPLTIIVASLGKGFGTGGGVAMLGEPSMFDLLQRHGGPIGWSQNMILPTIGASLASAAIHRSPELSRLQRTLRDNIDYFDQLFPTSLAGNGLPVRRIKIGDADEAVRISAELYKRGFYSSAVFFPIVPKGEAGLRIMIRADITAAQLASFVHNLTSLSCSEEATLCGA